MTQAVNTDVLISEVGPRANVRKTRTEMVGSVAARMLQARPAM